MSMSQDTKTDKLVLPKRKNANEVVGEVTSTRSQKTISVLVYSLMKHAKYKKYIRRTSVFKAHDEKELAKPGDRVRIFETRPLSKTKRWCLDKVLAKGEGRSSKREMNKEFGEQNIMEGIVKKEKQEIVRKGKSADLKADGGEEQKVSLGEGSGSSKEKKVADVENPGSSKEKKVADVENPGSSKEKKVADVENPGSSKEKKAVDGKKTQAPDPGDSGKE